MKVAQQVKGLIRTALVVLIATVCIAARAQEIPGYPTNFDAFDPREVAMLPPYCAFTQYFRAKVPGGNNELAIARWAAELGPTFIHLHHYCFALMKTNRAVLLARDARIKLFYLNDSLQEFDYVIDRAPPEFILLPEILTKKGINLVRLQKGPVALVEFERAAELKPDYWPPYAQMSDYYRDAGQKAKARDALKRGLKFSPDSEALKRRVAELKD